jgi:hypothetical protein
MSDRREDLTTASVKCYIYNNKTDIPTDPIIVPTQPVVNTGTTIVIPQVVVPTPPTTPTTPTVVTPTQPVIPTIPTTPVVPTTPTTPTVHVVVSPTVPVVVSQGSVNKELVLEFKNLSDMAEHFMTQNDITIRLVTKSPLKLGEVATLILEIKDKDGNPYSGLLPFSFTILSTNDSLQADISNIQMVNN